MCHVGDFNLSYGSLTSFNTCEKLQNLKMMDAEFWAELTTGKSEPPVVNDNVAAEDDMEAETARFEDDSNLTCEAVIVNVVDGHEVTRIKVLNGHLVSSAAIEKIDYESEKPDWAKDTAASNSEGSSSRAAGKRKVKVNVLYNGDNFWHH